MNSFKFDSVTEALQDVCKGVSFAGRAKKWETEDDGELRAAENVISEGHETPILFQ